MSNDFRHGQPKMTDTHFKLEETAFFYEQLAATFEQNNPVFEFFLNAFLASARSVTFVMVREYAHVPGFSEWWDGNTDKLRFQDFNDLRTIVIHQKPLRRHSQVAISTIDVVDEDGEVTGELVNEAYFEGFMPEVSMVVKDEHGNEQILPLETRRDFVVRAYHKDRKRDIELRNFLSQSSEYLEWLQSIVKECEQKFGVEPSQPSRDA